MSFPILKSQSYFGVRKSSGILALGLSNGFLDLRDRFIWIQVY